MENMDYRPGDVVPSHFDPAIVTASYFASLCGCYSTVELLHRRGTGIYNLRSWIDTFICATILGVIGIWCMHFIGNRAIILGSGAADIQLTYNAGWSAFSVLLPILGLCITFPIAEIRFKSTALRWISLACIGIFAGLSIVGMHYTGNFGIQNYHLNYKERFLAASIVIAIGDCLTVLVLFYTWREKWISAWWKRGACAIFLAGGISAMHFTASTKCIYTLKHYNGKAAIRSRNVQVIIAGVLCGFTGFVTFCLLLLSRRRARLLKRTSTKVMVACAMFDSEGRILVTTEGTLPAREITDKFDPYTFSEEFDTAHPVFQWIFRVTRNWSCVDEHIPGMRHHVETIRDAVEGRGSTTSSSSGFDFGSSGKYSLIFRERFCIAAASLATSFHMSIREIGILYDKIVDTGTLMDEGEIVRRRTIVPEQRFSDFELGVSVNWFGKGQLLFLTRELKQEEVNKVLNSGFRFGTMQQVGRQIARTMQIPLVVLEMHMSGLQQYIENVWKQQKLGTWLSCFAMIPKPNSKGFDLVVTKHNQSQLPEVQFLINGPSKWQVNFLKRMNTMTPSECMAFLQAYHQEDIRWRAQETQFALDLQSFITALINQLPSHFLDNARLYATPVRAHYTQPIYVGSPPTTLFAFVVCTGLHASVESSNELTRTPLSFFNARHKCYNDPTNRVALAQEIHQEFAPLASRRRSEQSRRTNNPSIHASESQTRLAMPTSRQPSKVNQINARDPFVTPSSSHEPNDSALVVSDQLSDQLSTTSTSPDQPNGFDGILTTMEVARESTRDFENDYDQGGAGPETGVYVTVGQAKPLSTFVDELVAFARAMFIR